MREHPTIFFFDGVCGLCNRNVNFLLRFDRREILKFSPLQSEGALEFFKTKDLPPPDYTTSILFHQGKFYFKSDTYLMALKLLGFPWSVLSLLRWVPKFLRDGIYDVIAANRFKVFGSLDTCRVPTPEERSRFL